MHTSIAYRAGGGCAAAGEAGVSARAFRRMPNPFSIDTPHAPSVSLSRCARQGRRQGRKRRETTGAYARAQGARYCRGGEQAAGQAGCAASKSWRWGAAPPNLGFHARNRPNPRNCREFPQNCPKFGAPRNTPVILLRYYRWWMSSREPAGRLSRREFGQGKQGQCKAGQGESAQPIISQARPARANPRGLTRISDNPINPINTTTANRQTKLYGEREEHMNRRPGSAVHPAAYARPPNH